MRRRDGYTTIDLRRELYDQLAQRAAEEGTTVPRLADRLLAQGEMLGEQVARLREDVGLLKRAVLTNGAGGATVK